MNRIAISTLYGLTNYGNRLQSYALQLKMCKSDSEAVILVPKNVPKEKNQAFLKRLAKTVLKKENGHLRLKTQEDYRRDFIAFKVAFKRQENFLAFTKKYVKTEIRVNRKQERTILFCNTYSFFIAGSDQVWNPHFWNSQKPMPEFERYLLTFASPEKRIAYAASFGVDELPPEWEMRMASELAKFKAISVREESGAKIVKKLTGRDVPVVLDPTMLLTADQWREIKTHNLAGDEKYILTYFLGPQPPEVSAAVQNEARDRGAEIIEMMDPKSKYYTLGPDGFLEMIDHAQAVFTDSFHGSVFSILFHKPFKVYQRHSEKYPSMGNRIDTLLSKTHLTECLRSGQFPTEEDFIKADALLEKERESSMQFLREALS